MLNVGPQPCHGGLPHRALTLRSVVDCFPSPYPGVEEARLQTFAPSQSSLYTPCMSLPPGPDDLAPNFVGRRSTDRSKRAWPSRDHTVFCGSVFSTESTPGSVSPLMFPSRYPSDNFGRPVCESGDHSQRITLATLPRTSRPRSGHLPVSIPALAYIVAVTCLNNQLRSLRVEKSAVICYDGLRTFGHCCCSWAQVRRVAGMPRYRKRARS
jgi:hypothetical protein